MARYTGPKSKIARKFGEAIYGEDKVLAKKNYPPGQHGVNKRRKTSEYGTQLKEKQKAKYKSELFAVTSYSRQNAHVIYKATSIYFKHPIILCRKVCRLHLRDPGRYSSVH